jgi:hypothetical protein
MRLINVHTLKLKDFQGEKPPYAILSHTWVSTEDEVSFADFQDLAISRKKAGFKKIAFICNEAKSTGIDYAWVDTCCIDKSSSAELSEAVNSMFRWYSKAEICYAYLSDVNLAPDNNPEDRLMTGRDDFLKKSKWFNRGWTLQELLAPSSVVFFDSNWRRIGDKRSYCSTISYITGIDNAVLLDSSKIFRESYATCIFWAAKRETTRDEDIAYCLMGILGVHMPLLYGEGKRAFRRLQYELFKLNSSHSLLTWGLHSEHPIDPGPNMSKIFPHPHTRRPILADEPSLFFRRPDFEPLNVGNDTKPSWVVTNRGIQIRAQVITDKNWFRAGPSNHTGVQIRYDFAIALLPLRPSEELDVHVYLGILLSGNSSLGIYNRISSHEGCETVRVPARLAVLAEPKEICLSEEPVYLEQRFPSAYAATTKLVLIESVGFYVQDVLVHRCEWNKGKQSLTLHPEIREEFQEALLRIVDEKEPESSFHLLVSNSLILPAIICAYPREEVWRFRKLGIAVVGDNYAKKLFKDASGLPQQGVQTNERNITVNMGKVTAEITLEQKQVYWDMIHVLTIGPVGHEESERQQQLDIVRYSGL